MQQRVWMAIVAALIVVCALQQAWILWPNWAPPVSPPVPPETALDPTALGKQLTMFPGANYVPRGEFRGGEVYGGRGYRSLVWLDVTQATFRYPDRANRIAEIGWHYAEQVARSIPGGRVSYTLGGRPGDALAYGLRSTYFVSFSTGVIVVSAAFVESPDGGIADRVNVYFLSIVGFDPPYHISITLGPDIESENAGQDKGDGHRLTRSFRLPHGAAWRRNSELALAEMCRATAEVHPEVPSRRATSWRISESATQLSAGR